jgi:hypothetical protein
MARERLTREGGDSPLVHGAPGARGGCTDLTGRICPGRRWSNAPQLSPFRRNPSLVSSRALPAQGGEVSLFTFATWKSIAELGER